MSTVKILLVEDDPSYAIELQMLVEELGYEVMKLVSHADEVFETLKNDKPDLVLMDIQINGELNGIEIASRIQEENLGIIFITSFDNREVYNEAQKTKNFGYIVKPFNHLTLEGAIESALMNLKREEEVSPEFKSAKEEVTKSWEEDLILKDYVFIKKRNRLIKVALQDIHYVEADGNYCLISTSDRKFVLKLSLVKVSQILSGKSFVRVSKSHIINMKRISSIELNTNKVTLGDHQFSIGKKYKEEVLKRLKLII